MDTFLERCWFGLKYCLFYPIVWLWTNHWNKNRDFWIPIKEFWKSALQNKEHLALEKPNYTLEQDGIQITGSDSQGTHIFLRLSRHRSVRQTTAVVIVRFKGEIYRLCSESENEIALSSLDLEGDDMSFEGGGLKIELRDTFKRWRITFRGYLRNESSNSEHFVRLEGWWHHMSDPVYLSTLHSPAQISSCLAQTENFQKVLEWFQKQLHDTTLEQWGQYTGRITIRGSGNDAELTQHEVILRGCKTRFNSEEDGFERRNENTDGHMYGYFEDGSCIHVRNVQFANYCEVVWCGYVFRPCGFFHPILCVKNSLQHFQSLMEEEQKTNPTCIYMNQVNGDKLLLKVVSCESHLRTEDPLERQSSAVGFGGLTLNGISGSGLWNLFQEYFPSDKLRTSLSPSNVLSQSYKGGVVGEKEEQRLAIPLNHYSAQHTSLSGGKAANLSRLISMEDGFKVPRGLIVTTSAYHLQFGSVLQEKLSHAGNNIIEVSEWMGGCGLSYEASEALIGGLEREWGVGEWKRRSFAVRSSGVGEDGVSSSAAGQLHTFLSVKGFKNIEESIMQCWASNLSWTVMEYRRQHGEPLYPPAAVILQEMVPAECAGVMFTNDPISGDTRRIIINACRGLGEDVVSGAVTPETIVIVRGGGEGGWVVEERGEGDSGLEDSEALALAEVGKKLEKEFGRAQDVEWAITGKHIYILQSRPITSLDLESDWELQHEFDLGVLSDKDDCFTTANIGEVLPEPVSPLTASSFALDKVFQTFFRNIQDIPDTTLFEIGLFGHTIQGDQHKTVARRRFQMSRVTSALKKLFFLHKLFIWKGPGELEDLKKKYIKREDILSDDPEAILEGIEARVEDTLKLLLLHTEVSSYSTGMGIAITGGILKKTSLDISPEQLSDMATIYSCCEDVVSAGVPNGLKKLAHTICLNDCTEIFRDMDTDEAVKWLEHLAPESVQKEYQEFLDTHGHRCPQEADVGRKTWKDNPASIIPSIQELVRSEDLGKEKVVVSVEEVMRRLTTPLNWIEKLHLRYFIPKARKSVAQREMTKNLICLLADVNHRKPIRRIGEILSQKGYLPDPELVFFLTTMEIELLVHHRHPEIVFRALRRRKALLAQSIDVYPEIMYGIPKPMQESGSDEAVWGSRRRMKGTVACVGKVTGVVRVAKTLQEAKLTKCGEILVTMCTDIGWSPFFPIIAGIVTELGGLLSHGAVIAREYGLPCLIGVTGATQSFRTGDLVTLDATKGLIWKHHPNTEDKVLDIDVNVDTDPK